LLGYATISEDQKGPKRIKSVVSGRLELVGVRIGVRGRTGSSTGEYWEYWGVLLGVQ
jgi:hypothetical protein